MDDDFDGDFGGYGDYDADDDVYAGTAIDDDCNYEDRVEGADVDGEMGEGEIDAEVTDDVDEDDSDPNPYIDDDPYDNRYAE